jgi:hypothetical protein
MNVGPLDHDELTSCCTQNTYICMRTTIDINDRLLAAARRRAAEDGITLTAFIEHALAACLTRRPAAAKPYRLTWKTHRGRTLPGVDVADRDRLFEQMEGRS